MALLVGSEYLTSITGAASGLATLDGESHITLSQLNLLDNATQPAGLVSGKLPLTQLTITPSDGTATAVAGLVSGKLPMNQLTVTPSDGTATAVAGLVSGKLPMDQLTVTPSDGTATAVAGLVGGIIPTTLLPTTVRNPFRGAYTTLAAITELTGQMGDYAFLDLEGSYDFYYYNPYLTTPGWDKQHQSSGYLSDNARALAAVPYILGT